MARIAETTRTDQTIRDDKPSSTEPKSIKSERRLYAGLRLFSNGVVKKAKTKTLLGMLFVVSVTIYPTFSGASTSYLRNGLNRVPINTFMTKGAFSAHFVDLEALRTLAQTHRIPLKLIAQERGWFGSNAVIKSFGSKASWTNYTGLPAGQPAALTIYPADTPNIDVTIWQFAKKDQADIFFKGLPDLGFMSARGLWSNGEPLKMDLSRSDPLDPFTGPMGYASVVAQVDNDAVQSHDPRAVETSIGLTRQDSLASLSSVRAALDALDKAAARGIVPQAYVISPFMWVSGSPDMVKILQDQLSRSQPLRFSPSSLSSVPPSIGALLVDVEMSDPPRRGALVILPYDNCRIAEKAATAFVNLWKEAPNQDNRTASVSTGINAVATRIKGNDNCTAVISLLAPNSRASEATADLASGGNPILRYILRAITNRDFAPLQGN